MNKKTVWTIVVIVIIILIIWALNTKPKPGPFSTGEVVKVGVLLPLSGNFVAWWGETIKNGVQLAESSGLTKNLEFVFQDTQCNTKDAVSGTQALKAQYPDMHLFVVGCDNDLKAMLPILNKDKDLAFVAGLSGPDLYESHFPIINLSYRLEAEARAAIDFLAKKPEVKTLGVIYGNNMFGIVTEENLSKYFAEVGGKTVSEQIGLNDSKPDTVVLKILQSKPDAIYIHNDIPTISAILKRLNELGFKGPRIITYAGRDQSLIEAAGKAAEGTLVPWVINDSLSKAQQDFVDSYKAKYSKDPFVTSYFVYDGVTLISKANSVCNGDARCIENYVYKTDFSGVLGSVKYKSDGQVDRTFYFDQVKDGKFVEVK